MIARKLAIKNAASTKLSMAVPVAVVDALSQRARAYQGFTQQILSGGIRAGQFISQRELMALLDMPLGAVREMIPRLEAGGLVNTVPQRGLQIAHVDLKLIRNAFQVRSMIEREAIRNFVHTATDAELAAIEASHRAILVRAAALVPKKPGPALAVDAQLLDDAQAVDWGLHDRMVDALGNDIVSEIYRVNSLRVRLIKLEHSVITPARLIPAIEEHLTFIAALIQRNEAGALAMLEAHIQSAQSRVLNAPLAQVRNEWLQPGAKVNAKNTVKPTKRTKPNKPATVKSKPVRKLIP
jgi:DNA-binding GntR family transcriptional regulator